MSFAIIVFLFFLSIIAILALCFILKIVLRVLKRAKLCFDIAIRCDDGLISKEELDTLNKLEAKLSFSKEDQLLFENKAKQILTR